MSDYYLLAGGIVEAGAGQPGQVSAYVAFRGKPGSSRLFKVQGPLDGPEVRELPSATTVDLHAFRAELKHDLDPTVRRIEAHGGTATVVSPEADWVYDLVAKHMAAASK